MSVQASHKTQRVRRLRMAVVIFSAAVLSSPAFAKFDLGVAYQGLSYSQSGGASGSESAIQLMGDYDAYANQWEAHSSVSVTLLPYGGSMGDYRTIDADISGGFALAGTFTSRLSLLGGIYYATTLTGNSSLGYENGFFAEAGVGWVHRLKDGYLNFRGYLMPQLNGGSSEGFGFEGDLKWTFSDRAPHPLSLNLDYTDLKVTAGAASASSSSLAVGLTLGL